MKFYLWRNLKFGNLKTLLTCLVCPMQFEATFIDLKISCENLGFHP